MGTLKNVFSSSFLLLAAFLLFSCGGSQEKKENAEDTTKKVSDVKEVKIIDYPLSTPLEITKMLNSAKASYILDVSNPAKNIDKYISENKQALNLGVYAADLSYASVYNKAQETKSYLANAKKLSDDLGISTVYNKDIVERVEKNINNKDTLHAIISKSFEDTYKKLQEGGKGAVSLIVISGGLVEGIYITSQLAILSKQNAEITKVLASQKINLDKLMVALEAYKDDANIKEVTADLKSMKDVYEKVDANKSMSKQVLEELSAVVEKIRTKFVK